MHSILFYHFLMGPLLVCHTRQNQVHPLVLHEVRLAGRRFFALEDGLILVEGVKAIEIVAVFELRFDPHLPGLLPNLHLFLSLFNQCLFNLIKVPLVALLVLFIAKNLVL